MFGGGAESLVGGDTRALEYARRYKRLNQLGMAVYLVGLATMIVAPFALDSLVHGDGQKAAELGGLGAGAAITLGGMTLMFKGDAALIDAVNVYNEGVADAARAGRP